MMSRRFGRLLLGVGLIGAAGYVGVPHLTHRISTAAVINGELIRLSAPTPGIADPALPTPGTVLAAGTEIPLVRRLVPEERERFRLANELAAVRAQIDRLRRSLAVLEAHEQDVARRGEHLVEAAAEVLLREREEVEAAHEAARARVVQLATEVAHAEEMHRRGLFAATRVEAARAAHAAALAEAQTMTARIARIEAQRRALLAGVHLRDGFNDVPYSVQQRDRILLLRETALDRLAEATARETVLTAAIAMEEVAQGLRERFAHRLEAPMLVWQRHATPAAPVGPGDTLLDLVRCDRMFVEVSLPDRAFASIVPGVVATVRVAGGVVLEGEVSSVRGAGARNRSVLTAAEVPGEAGARLTARVALPQDAADKLAHPSDGSFCGIGRLAEVSFPAAGSTLQDIASAVWRRTRALAAEIARLFPGPASATVDGG